MAPIRHVSNKLLTINFSDWGHGFTEHEGEEQDMHKMMNAIGHGIAVAALKLL